MTISTSPTTTEPTVVVQQPDTVHHTHQLQISVPTAMLVSLMTGVGLWASGAPYVREAGIGIASLSIALGCAHQCCLLTGEALARTEGGSVGVRIARQLHGASL